MKNMVFFKKSIKLTFFYLFLILCLFHITSIKEYTKNALIMWYELILPSQFFMIVLVNWVKYRGIRIKNTSVRTTVQPKNKLYLISRLLFLGFLFGFPCGAILIGSQYQEKQISKAEAHLLIAACNQFGPAYLFGFVFPTYGTTYQKTFSIFSFLIAFYFFPIICVCFFYLITYILGKQAISYTVQNPQWTNEKQEKSFQDIIMESLLTISKLAGYMMFFSSLQFLVDVFITNPTISLYCKAIFEISFALNILASKFAPFSVFFLILGCLSGIAQTSCILAEYRLSIFPYLIQKIGYAIIGCLLVMVLH